MSKQDDFGSILAHAHFRDLQAEHLKNVVALLRRLAESDLHKSFSKDDLQAVICSAVSLGGDVVAAMLRTETLGVNRVATAQDLLKSILFSTEAPGPGLSGQPLKDFLRQLADDLENQLSYEQRQNMLAAWLQIAAL